MRWRRRKRDWKAHLVDLEDKVDLYTTSGPLLVTADQVRAIVREELRMAARQGTRALPESRE